MIGDTNPMSEVMLRYFYSGLYRSRLLLSDHGGDPGPANRGGIFLTGQGARSPVLDQSGHSGAKVVILRVRKAGRMAESGESEESRVIGPGPEHQLSAIGGRHFRLRITRIVTFVSESPESSLCALSTFWPDTRFINVLARYPLYRPACS